MLGRHQTPQGETVSVSGDVFNTLSVLTRYGQRTALYTALGHDAATPVIHQAILNAGIDDAYVAKHPQYPNGLYESYPSGMTYHRNDAACRRLIRDIYVPPEELLLKTRGLFLSGVTLAVCYQDLDYFENLFRMARHCGVSTALDANYRPALWASSQDAWLALSRLLPYTDVFLPSMDDMTGLLNLQSVSAALDAINDYPQMTTALTMGKSGAMVHVPPMVWTAEPPKVYPDEWMLGAGDAFNGGFLATWLMGESAELALQIGIEATAESFMLRLLSTSMNHGPDPLEDALQMARLDKFAHAV